MPTIVAHHDITKGKYHWLALPKRKELFGSVDVTNIRTFVNPANLNNVAVVVDVPSMDAFNSVMKSQAAADVMAHVGVVPESLVVYLEC